MHEIERAFTAKEQPEFQGETLSSLIRLMKFQIKLLCPLPDTSCN